MPEIYQSRHAGTIADLLRQRGQIGARAAQQAGDLQAQRALTSGQAWGNAIQNIGQTVSGTLADFARQKADAPRRAMEDELQRLRLAVTRGELTQQRLEQMGAEIESQATRPDGSVDRDLLTSLFQQNGIGALLPPVLREIDKREGALRQEQEGRGKQLFAATPAGPISEDALQTMNQSPEAQPHLRYNFGPGTAEGPERLETMPERRMREAEAFASEQGGVVSPTGAITLPPRETPVNTQRAEVLLDGKPALVVFNPRTEKFTRNGVDVTDRVQPIPPREPSGANEPLMAVMGDDGQPVYMPRSQAIGRRPASNREQGRAVTSGDAGELAEFATALDDIATVTGALSGNRATGTMAKAGAMLPNAVTEVFGWGTEAKQKQAVIDRVKQVIGKALEGGVLRKEDELKYAKILPTIGDTPEVVTSKLQGLDLAIKARIQRKIDALEDAGYDVQRFRQRIDAHGKTDVVDDLIKKYGGGD